ncbi:MAG: hypothetical protein ABIC95_03095 [archaeon]
MAPEKKRGFFGLFGGGGKKDDSELFGDGYGKPAIKGGGVPSSGAEEGAMPDYYKEDSEAFSEEVKGDSKGYVENSSLLKEEESLPGGAIFNLSWWEYSVLLIEIVMVVYVALVFLNFVPLF